jgi:hypothetical protein
MTKSTGRPEELTVRVGDKVVLSQAGAHTGLNGAIIERDVLGGWRRSAQVNDVYCLGINPTPFNSDRVFDRDRAAESLKNALRIRDSDVDDVLSGKAGVLLPLDGTNYFLLLELLRALNLSFRLYTVANAN